MCQPGQNLGLFVAGAQLLLHLFYLGGNSFIPFMFLKSFKEIQLGVLLDFHTQIIQLLYGRVAGKEIQRPGAERNDLQAA